MDANTTPRPLRCGPGDSESLATLRSRIDEVDRELLASLALRADLARAVAGLKRLSGLPPVDPAREAEVVRRAVARARTLQIPAEEVRDLVWRTLALCREAQRTIPPEQP